MIYNEFFLFVKDLICLNILVLIKDKTFTGTSSVGCGLKCKLLI